MNHAITGPRPREGLARLDARTRAAAGLQAVTAGLTRLLVTPVARGAGHRAPAATRCR